MYLLQGSFGENIGRWVVAFLRTHERRRLTIAKEIPTLNLAGCVTVSLVLLLCFVSACLSLCMDALDGVKLPYGIFDHELKRGYVFVEYARHGCRQLLLYAVLCAELCVNPFCSHAIWLLSAKPVAPRFNTCFHI